jgi:hypothetical protein
MALRLPIGISDFRKLREQGAEYVDKSHLLIEILDRATEVLLLPRPRRFGKTVNLSMLRYFFEKRPEDLSYLFHDLAIWRSGDAYRRHFQRYPVIFLTFREVKASSFDGCWADLRKTIQSLFREHQALLSSGVLSERETRDYRADPGERVSRGARRRGGGAHSPCRDCVRRERSAGPARGAVMGLTRPEAGPWEAGTSACRSSRRIAGGTPRPSSTGRWARRA